MKNKIAIKGSPCGGCPKCCAECVFSSAGTALEPEASVQTVVAAKAYGCIKGFGNVILDAAGMLGQMRGALFHPVSPTGAVFLKQSGNSLARHVAV